MDARPKKTAAEAAVEALRGMIQKSEKVLPRISFSEIHPTIA